MRKHSSNCRQWREAIRLQICEELPKEKVAAVHAHRDACAECQRYAKEMCAAAATLRSLASGEVSPSTGFRRRWSQAVVDAAQPWTPGDALAACAEWLRGWLSRNLRPASAIASLWLLALLFRLSAPAASPSSQTALAHSPTQIAWLLKAEERLIAARSQAADQPSVPQLKIKPSQPRSGLRPSRPAAGVCPSQNPRPALAVLLPNSCLRTRVPANNPSPFFHEPFLTQTFSA